MSIESLAQYFNTIEDPRCGGKIEHRLRDILVIAVCAVIACADSWDDIALYGRSKLAWLRTFLDLPNGIASHDTFRRVFMLIDPDAFETGFTAWVGSLTAGFEREVVAIDGKTIRCSFEHGREQSPLHVVSAWASEQGLVLGQRCVDGKSNEITAVPELLDQLALQNTIVTLDAMGEAGQGCACAAGGKPAEGARRRLPRRSWHVGATTCWRSRATTSWPTRPWSSISTSTASAVAHPTGPIATRSTTRMAAWSAAGCSPARTPPPWMP